MGDVLKLCALTQRVGQSGAQQAFRLAHAAAQELRDFGMREFVVNRPARSEPAQQIDVQTLDQATQLGFRRRRNFEFHEPGADGRMATGSFTWATQLTREGQPATRVPICRRR